MLFVLSVREQTVAGNEDILRRILAAALTWYERYESVQVSTPSLWVWELRARLGCHGERGWSRRLPDKYTAIMRVCVVILLSVMSAGPVVVSECQCMTVVFIEVDFDLTTHNFV